MSEEPITGKVLSIRATIECGGCRKQFVVGLDPARTPPWPLFDEAVDAIRGNVDYHGSRNGGSVQGGHLLCGDCTVKVDDALPDDLTPTAEQVAAVLNKAAGV